MLPPKWYKFRFEKFSHEMDFQNFFLDWNISLALGGCHFFHSKSSPSFRNTPTNIDLWNLNSYLFTPSLQCQYVRPRPWQLWSWLLRYGLGLHHGLRQVPSQWGEVCSNSSRFTVGSIVMAVFGILQSGLQVPNREQGVRVHARARSCVCVCVRGGAWVIKSKIFWFKVAKIHISRLVSLPPTLRRSTLPGPLLSRYSR